jgi:hypothetical protein
LIFQLVEQQMKNHLEASLVIVASLWPFLALGFLAHSQASDTVQKETAKMTRANGSFEVKLTPQRDSDSADIGRMTIDKQFHGDLEGTSKGQMLTAGTAVKGSAGYVAIEKVNAKLHGRNGTFVLQHSGTMTRGTPQLSVTVVPDSGTGDLVGLTGKMTINIENGKHFYVFEYTLPEKP